MLDDIDIYYLSSWFILEDFYKTDLLYADNWLERFRAKKRLKKLQKNISKLEIF